MPLSSHEILERATTIAVVGASRDPNKAGGSVPFGLQQRGFRIIPINPFADELFGERVYRSLREVPFKIDLVDVFRPAEDAPEIARQASRWALVRCGCSSTSARPRRGGSPRQPAWITSRTSARPW